jgi:hypothetical protein
MPDTKLIVNNKNDVKKFHPNIDNAPNLASDNMTILFSDNVGTFSLDNASTLASDNAKNNLFMSSSSHR